MINLTERGKKAVENHKNNDTRKNLVKKAVSPLGSFNEFDTCLENEYGFYIEIPAFFRIREGVIKTA